MLTTAHLFIIDPQNGFTDNPNPPTGMKPALPVAGAHDDMLRTAAFIDRMAPVLRGITVTRDRHPLTAVYFESFWRDVAPYTLITSDDLRLGRRVPVQAKLKSEVIAMLDALEARGKSLIVWPVHCVADTWDQAIHPAIAAAIASALAGTSPPDVHYVDKGQHAMVEHYGVFEAELPLPFVPSTQFNAALAKRITVGVWRLYIAGEALSHCVAASVEQLLDWLEVRGGCAQDHGITLLTDCMSPVGSFEDAGHAFLQRAQARGCRLMTSAQALVEARQEAASAPADADAA